MPQKNSPPPTPVSSPRVSPTPPESPIGSSPSGAIENNFAAAQQHQQQSSLSLSPSNIPLRPVHAPDNAPSLNIISVDPAPSSHHHLLSGVDDMDIDDTGGLSPNGSPVRGGTGAGATVGVGNTSVGSDDGSGAGSEPDWSTDDWMVDMRRVKVYELVGATWIDRGTALCTGVYDEELDTAAIVAKSELNDVELLRSEIRASDVYQKQQDTLIVWTEPDGTDYALSFQDMEGCSEIWDFVVEVQRHFRGKSQTDPNSSFSSGSGDAQSRLTVASIIASGRLPEPALGIISDLDTAIKAIAKTIHGRERICEYILNEDYIKALIDVMEQAEDLESLPDLHALHGIIQTILSMNDHGIYDYVLHEDIFLGVVGILEYDPEFPTFKASYREFLKNNAHYQRTFQFNDENVQRKIAQTYRLQYLKDVVLARVIDDSTFNVLNSFILFNQIDIINHIIGDNPFLTDLFKPFVTSQEILKASSSQNLYGSNPDNSVLGAAGLINGNVRQRETAPSPPPSPRGIIGDLRGGSTLTGLYTRANGVSVPSTRSDAIRFVHQLCLMGKNVQIPTRIALYRALVERGLLFALEWALRYPLASEVNGKRSNITAPTINGASSLVGQRDSTHQTLDAMSTDPDPPLLDMVAEIFILVAEFNITGVRAHIVRQSEAAKAREAEEQQIARASPPVPVPVSGKPVHTPAGTDGKGTAGQPHLLKALTARLGGIRERPFRNQIGDAIRLLLESPPNLDFQATGDAKGNTLIKLREDPVNEHFFPVFYDPPIISAFYKPLLDLDDWRNMPHSVLKLSREQAALFLYLCDLLCTMLVQHSHRSQYFILSSGISPKIASLLRSRDKHMRLASLRYFRTCIRINNHFVIRHLIKHGCFAPILTLVAEEAGRDNLVSASCQEFFENIRKDNLRLPMTHIMEKYEDKIRALAELELVGSRFRAFILRWEQNSAPAPPTKPAETIVETTPDARRWGQGTNLDAEEESYFNGSDDDEDTAASSQPTALGATMMSSQATMWAFAHQQATRAINQRRIPRGAARAATSPQRTTRSSTAAQAAAAAAAAAPQPSLLSHLTARPDTPTPSSPGRAGSPIMVPRAYPMRSLLDYGEDENDDEFIGPMPAIEELDEAPTAGPSTSVTPVVVKSGAGVGRSLHRTESVSDLAGLNRAATAVASQQNGATVAAVDASSSSNIPPSNLRRSRGGSIFGSEAVPNLTVSASSAPSAPPLKRRREEEDEDELLSLMSRTTRRKSLEAKSSGRSPSPVAADAKGKGKETVSAQSQNEKVASGEKQGTAKRIRLSLKAALGLGKDNGAPTSRSPSPSLSATASVKDGDGG